MKIATLSHLVLHILGIGTAVGHTALGKADFKQCGISDCTLGEGELRRSSLERSYLVQSKNADINLTRHEGNQSPTDLCFEAAQAALADAKISSDQIGLVIGECCTPWQTTPSEGQRVADRLGLKVPAYDIGGGGLIPQHIAALAQWKSERVPEYTLLVSGGTPTARINFAAGGAERWQFSDAACACIVSTKHRGKLAVIDAASYFIGKGNDCFVVDQFLPLQAKVGELAESIERLTSDAVAKAIFKNKLHGAHVALACGEASSHMADRIGETHGIARRASNFELFGDTLSSGSFLAFEKIRKNLSVGERVIFAQALPGFIAGYAVCEVQSL